MWITIADVLATAAHWLWIDPLTTFVHAATSVINLVAAVHRASRSRDADRYRRKSDIQRRSR